MKETLRKILWQEDGQAARAFDLTMIGLIVLSIVGMTVETIPGITPWEHEALSWFNLAIMLVFTIEYGLRTWSAPQPMRYVLSFWGLVDLLAFLPFWLAIGSGSQSVRALRILRLLKLMRYVPAIERMRRAMQLVWRELSIVLMMAVLMIFLTGVGIYNFESDVQPEKFGYIPQSLWFAVATLTTVGYGDAYPVTVGGKVFTFLMLMIGLGIVALPAAVVGAAMQQAREEQRRRALADEEEMLAARIRPARRTPGWDDGITGE